MICLYANGGWHLLKWKTQKNTRIKKNKKIVFIHKNVVLWMYESARQKLIRHLKKKLSTEIMLYLFYKMLQSFVMLKKNYPLISVTYFFNG